MKKQSFKPVSTFAFLFFVFTLWSHPTLSVKVARAQEAAIVPSNAYVATYRQGEAPLRKRAKVKIFKSNASYIFMPTKGEAWSLSLKNIRGAVEAGTGFWFYWFDANNQTLSSFFKMGSEKSALVSEINSAVNNYFLNPPAQQKYKATFEAYKEKALEESE